MLIKDFIKYLWGGVNLLLRFPLNTIRFKECKLRTHIISPLKVTYNCICIGNATIWNNARLEGVFKYNDKTFSPLIIIHDGVSIQQDLHLTCAGKIEIGKNTAIAARVTITDINHPYVDINVPIERQDIEVKEVYIGDDCKIYNGVVILPGVTIGKHVTIGANSVVTHNIPDFCVAVGAPAHVIKRYNTKSQQWEKTDKHGNFIE